MNARGVVRSINSWGTLTLPQRMKRHGETHLTGECVLFLDCIIDDFNAPTVTGHYILIQLPGPYARWIRSCVEIHVSFAGQYSSWGIRWKTSRQREPKFSVPCQWALARLFRSQQMHSAPVLAWRDILRRKATPRTLPYIRMTDDIHDSHPSWGVYNGLFRHVSYQRGIDLQCSGGPWHTTTPWHTRL